jgi:DNA mismatch endonuclease (patch repair protein)
MVDVFSQKKRSEIMQKIGAKHSKPEKYVRSIVHRMGYRFRLHRKDLPGKPDMVFPKYRKVIFVHGCFWHGHEGCPRAKRPSSNKKFWSEKLKKNIERDKKNQEKLNKMDWDYIIIWQCQIKKGREEELCQTLTNFLKGS